MSAHFYDSSAFAKLFISEPGTDAMLDLYRAASLRCVSRLVFLEVGSAIRRRELEGDLQPAQVARARTLLQAETVLVRVVSVSDDVVAAAQSLMDRHAIRSLDAIQPASALLIAAEHIPLLFVSADTRLLNAAVSEGLLVSNPLVV